MTLREFFRFHLLKTLLALVVLQVIIIAIIQSYNHKPQAARDQVSVIEERTVKITPLTNDTDKDENDELSVLNVSDANSGSVEQNRNLLFYTPKPGFVGVDSFAYTISDGKKESKESFVVIQVNENLEPLATSDTISIYQGGASFIDVLSNDRDRENDSIFIIELSDPLYGRVKLEENKLIYSAGNAPAVTDSFQYVVSDGKSNTEPVSVIVNVKSKNDPCYPWLGLDIGNYSIPGSLKCANNKIIIEASGNDIWNNVDGLHYVYQYIDGDCEMLAKIESLEASHEWAKAAIMVRESLGGDSKTSMVLMANTHGIRSQNRFETNGGMSGSDPHAELKPPYWMKLVRTGDVFTYFISENGAKWKEIDSQENAMPKNVYIGFGFTSHNNNELAKAVFSNYKLQAKLAKIGDF